MRIAFGAIGPVPRRMMEIEDRLKGEVISKGLIQKMEEYIPEDVVRSRSRKEYRRNVVKNFTIVTKAQILRGFKRVDYGDGTSKN